MSCGVFLLALAFSGCTAMVNDDAAPTTSESLAPPAALAFEAEDGLPELIDLAMVKPAAGPPSEVSLADQGAVIIADLLYDGLTEAVGTEGRLAPGLATSWEANAEFTEWTFAIDSSRIAPSVVADHFGDLVDEPSHPGIGGVLDPVTSIDLVDGDQVRFTMNEPVAALPWLLSGVGTSVVGPDGATTGPYGITSDDGNGMVLNPAIDPDATDEIRPAIVVTWADTPQEAYDQLTLGLVDGAVAPSSVLDDAADRFGVDPQARSLSRFYVFNASSAAVDDQRVRDAIQRGTDRHSIAAQAFSGPVVTADGVVGPTTAGYRRNACGAPCDADSETAAALVAELEEEGAFPGQLTVAYSGSEQAGPATALADSILAVGLDAVAVDYEPDDLVAAIVSGQADLYAYGVVPAAGSIDAIVPGLFASQSPSNLTGVASPQIDALIADAASTADDDKRWAILGQAHELGLQEGRLMPLAVAKSHLVLNPQTSGLTIRADGSIDFKSTQ